MRRLAQARNPYSRAVAMDSEFAREELAPRNDTVNESQSGQKFSDLL